MKTKLKYSAITLYKPTAPEKYYKRERAVHKMSEVKEYYKIKREQKRPWENMYSGMQEGRRRGFYG